MKRYTMFWARMDEGIPTQGASIEAGATEFLILSENGYRMLGANPTTTCLNGPGNPENGGTGYYDDSQNGTNTATSPYTFHWTYVGTDEDGLPYGYIINSAGEQLQLYTANMSKKGFQVRYVTSGGSLCKIIREGDTFYINATLNYVTGKPSFEGWLRSPNYDVNRFSVTTYKENGGLTLYTKHDTYTSITYTDEYTLDLDTRIGTVEGYGTYYNAEDAYKMPAGVTGYFIKGVTYSNTQSVLNLTQRYEPGDIVPAGTPLLLSNNDNGLADYKAIPYMHIPN